MEYKHTFLFSIITVCFNEEKSIRKTIESVLNQSFSDYEYIICDGGSTDDTLNIIESYQDAFKKKGIRYLVHSEKDGGIYFGMNIGVALSTGKYLNFMNAADTFHTSTVLQEAASYLQSGEVDILYGDILRIVRHYSRLEVGDFSLIEKRMPFCHQAMFIKQELLQQHPYDTTYRIAADYEFVLAMWAQKKKFTRADIIVADFSFDGISSTQREQLVEEDAAIALKYNLPFDYDAKLRTARKNSRRDKLRDRCPECLWILFNWIHGKKRIK